MAKIPFLIRKGFNLEDRVEGNQLFGLETESEEENGNIH